MSTRWSREEAVGGGMAPVLKPFQKILAKMAAHKDAKVRPSSMKQASWDPGFGLGISIVISAEGGGW